MSSSLATLVRKFNFTSTSTPAILGLAQKGFHLISAAEIAAAARWSVVGGFLVYWMIEPKMLSERAIAAAEAAAEAGSDA